MTRLAYLVGLMGLLSLACSSGDEARDRDGGSTAGSGGGGSGGTSGSGGTAWDGGGGEGIVEAGPDLEMPTGCVPSDMTVVCNPVTNEGCDSAAGEACEYGIEEYFMCFPAPNDVDEGGACNWEEGPWCKATFVCSSDDPESPSGVCRRPCCSDADCGSKSCVVADPEFGTLGICR
jgi:hypothetical protein